MRGAIAPQASMFSCVDLESRIPTDHPMRKIVDVPLQAIEPWSGDRYAAAGRPPVPPEMLQGTWLKSFEHKDIGEHAPPTGGGGREEDVISDDVPALGLLDDAIVAELVVRELEPEIEAYQEFCKIRAVSGQLEGKQLSRDDWLKEKQHMLFEQMRDRRQRDRRTAGGVGRLTRFSLA